jgi:UDP-glucose:(heptosyl)LPS alpha-1,3-glucosyltransferase
MKIAMLIKNFITTGGAERYAVELSHRLARRGHGVHVFAQRWDADLLEGVTLHPIRRIRVSHYLNALWYALAARRANRRQSFDIIHSHQRTIEHDVISMHHPCYRIGRADDGIIRRLLHWLGGRISPRHRVYRWLERRQFCNRNVRAIVAVSQGIKEDILAHYPEVGEAKVRVIHPGVDVGRMSPERIARHRNDIRKQHGLTADAPAIIFVGSEFKRKGLRYAIEALGLLEHDRQVAVKPHLFVLGSGEPTEYRELAEGLAIADRIHFVGLYSPVEHYYAAADMCLLPTLSDPFPLVVLEAMACGLPVIVSAGQGVAEVLQNGVNALLLDDPRDTRTIAACIVQLCDSVRRSEMGARARRTAETLTWERMTDEIERLYASVNCSAGEGRAPNAAPA